MALTLRRAIGSGATRVPTTGSETTPVPFYAHLDSEVVLVEAIYDSVADILRGRRRTAQATHAQGATLTPFTPDPSGLVNVYADGEGSFSVRDENGTTGDLGSSGGASTA